jgi:hypothetical protein
MFFAQTAFVAAAALTIPLTACSGASPANTEARAKEATASAIAGATVEQIVITQLQSGAAKWTWKAEAGGKTYECDADELLRLPDCRPVS